MTDLKTITRDLITDNERRLGTKLNEIVDDGRNPIICRDYHLRPAGTRRRANWDERGQ